MRAQLSRGRLGIGWGKLTCSPAASLRFQQLARRGCVRGVSLALLAIQGAEGRVEPPSLRLLPMLKSKDNTTALTRSLEGGTS